MPSMIRRPADLAADRAAYQASLDIAVRLAAADRLTPSGKRDLALIRQKIDDLGKSVNEGVSICTDGPADLPNALLTSSQER